MERPGTATLTDIHRFVFKGQEVEPLKSVVVTPQGIEHDRLFEAVVSHDEGKTWKFVSQRTHPNLTKVRTEVDEKVIRIILPYETLSLPREGQQGDIIEFEMHKGRDGKPEIVQARDQGVRIGEVFRDFARKEGDAKEGAIYRIVCKTADLVRAVDSLYDSVGDANHNLSDGFPITIGTAASLQALNDRTPPGTPECEKARLRMNYWLEGLEAGAEHDLAQIIINGVVYDVVKDCGRCGVPGFNLETREKDGTEIVKAFERRTVDGKMAPVFGVKAIPRKNADQGRSASVGDTVELVWKD